MTELYEPHYGPIPAEHKKFYTELGRRFRAARIARGFTLEQLATVAKITPEQLVQCENAETIFPIFALLSMLKHMGYSDELQPGALMKD